MSRIKRKTGRIIGFVTAAAVILATLAYIFLSGVGGSKPVLTQGESNVMLVKDGKAAPVYISAEAADYEGLRLAAQSFCEDVKLVTGATPAVVTNAGGLDGTAIIAGSIGNNKAIDALIQKGVLDVSEIKGKRECYKIQVVDSPIRGAEQAVVIAGSDKRGTIYGLYHISELMGVSPWVYWGDVVPAHRDELVFSAEELNVTSKEPSVKYRGIFLNDEWPSLGSWVTNTFGGFNEKFYAKVFELILRLKGNFMWPAMWSAVFSEDGESDPQASAKLADTYGIVMGTSHHEPMFRAGEEWKRINAQYGKNPIWDFATNGEAITRFWEDGLRRNKDYESIITMGMRGEADSALFGTAEQNINLLKSIITTQKELLKKQGLDDAPKVLTVYKEVEKYWYGNEKVPGLRYWDGLDDITIMMTDDNFANVRTLPTAEERDRKAGWGMYYHFDYHGGPKSYEWVNVTPLTKVWEQMSMAYDYGVRDIWIVNVGDLKPMELPISYFLDLAYDFDTWGTSAPNTTDDYTRRWAAQQFGAAVDADTVNGIAAVLTDYTKLSGARKPEVTYGDTYSITHYDEARRVLAQYIDLETRAKKYLDLMPDAYKDAYWQLMYYPAAATATVVKMQIYAGLNDLYYKRGSTLANDYAALVKSCIGTDHELEKYYNNTLSGGKWKGMMSSPHIGYTRWDPDGWRYPVMRVVTPVKGSVMLVDVAGFDATSSADDGAMSADRGPLLSFTNLGQERYAVNVSNGGDTAFDYTVSASVDWIKVSKTAGSVKTGETLEVSVDWSKVSERAAGYFTVSGADGSVQIAVTADVIDTTGLPDMTFVETHGVVSIEAAHTSGTAAASGVTWIVLENYGRSLSSVKMYPTTAIFDKPGDAPYLEYTVRVDADGAYTLTTITAPTNNLAEKSRLRYAVAIDGGAPVVADALPRGYITGSYENNLWQDAVLVNCHKTATTHLLTKGVHTIRIYGMDAGLVLQKLILSKNPLPASYFGPEESWYVGKKQG